MVQSSQIIHVAHKRDVALYPANNVTNPPRIAILAAGTNPRTKRKPTFPLSIQPGTNPPRIAILAAGTNPPHAKRKLVFPLSPQPGTNPPILDAGTNPPRKSTFPRSLNLKYEPLSPCQNLLTWNDSNTDSETEDFDKKPCL